MDSLVQDVGTLRPIVHRTSGQTHGPITRLVSPGDLGKVLKPFVFVDLFDNGRREFRGFGLHPHSGIATLTYMAEGSTSYEDTNGARGSRGLTTTDQASRAEAASTRAARAR